MSDVFSLTPRETMAAADKMELLDLRKLILLLGASISPNAKRKTCIAVLKSWMDEHEEQVSSQCWMDILQKEDGRKQGEKRSREWLVFGGLIVLVAAVFVLFSGLRQSERTLAECALPLDVQDPLLQSLVSVTFFCPIVYS